ncbi:MAG TPA: hypothetical protein VM261_18780 [Kofleriaceae bacterium]|nr:hypothetical protein [Kofleriaceae bacterium]
MSGEPNMRRSQQIMRLPVEDVYATLILHDGERSEVILFVSPDEDIERVLGAREPFLPVVRNGKVALVARRAIAALGVSTVAETPVDGDLPVETQHASVRLRSGATLEGELRWTAPAASKRTADYLNADEAFVKVHTPETTFYVVKDQIALVEEH